MPYNPNIHHRRSIRLEGYDYAQLGWYFVTVCVQGGECLFGEVVDRKMVWNEYGQIAYDEWMNTPTIRPQIELDAFVVMPNHIHGIIKINDVRRGELNSPNTKMGDIHKGEFNSPLRGDGGDHAPINGTSQTVGAIVRGYKSAVTKQLRLMGFEGKLWQRNYYEHIVRDEVAYQNIAHYIINNPARWEEDMFYKRQ